MLKLFKLLKFVKVSPCIFPYPKVLKIPHVSAAIDRRKELEKLKQSFNHFEKVKSRDKCSERYIVARWIQRCQVNRPTGNEVDEWLPVLAIHLPE
jgi:hypothetical protein